MEQMDWSNLGFGYRKTDYNVRCYYRDGKWGEIEVCSEETIPLHMAATCLHYGQEAFTRTLPVCRARVVASSCLSFLQRNSMRWWTRWCA